MFLGINSEFVPLDFNLSTIIIWVIFLLLILWFMFIKFASLKHLVWNHILLIAYGLLCYLILVLFGIASDDKTDRDIRSPWRMLTSSNGNLSDAISTIKHFIRASEHFLYNVTKLSSRVNSCLLFLLEIWLVTEWYGLLYVLSKWW